MRKIKHEEASRIKGGDCDGADFVTLLWRTGTGALAGSAAGPFGAMIGGTAGAVSVAVSCDERFLG
jgi:hypothetical protein